MKRIFFGSLLTGSIVMLVFFYSCKDEEQPEPEPDKIECSITKPADNDTVQLGNTVSISADASYNNGKITKVSFFVDGSEIGTSSSPYTYDWNTTGTTGGEHTLKATAETENGKSTSDEIKLLVIGDATVAEAGKDTAVCDGSTSVVLYANAPQFDFENGEWSIIEGDGGSFNDASKYDAEFSGELNTIYTLTWTISNKYDNSTDTVQVMFNSVTDIDGNVYRTVKIGDQWWMAENLKVTKFPDGEVIPLVTDNIEWEKLPDDESDMAKAYCYLNNNEDSKYGALYTFAAANEACPSGWHLPDDLEWMELSNFIAADNDGIYKNIEGHAIKSKEGWKLDGNGADIYGFTALPGGKRYYEGSFSQTESFGFWRGRTSSNMVSYILLQYNNSIIATGRSNIKSDGMSVRCVKD